MSKKKSSLFSLTCRPSSLNDRSCEDAKLRRCETDQARNPSEYLKPDAPSDPTNATDAIDPMDPLPMKKKGKGEEVASVIRFPSLKLGLKCLPYPPMYLRSGFA
jgi:hypothetical protein